MNYRLPVNGEWFEYSDETLATLRKQGKPGHAQALEDRQADYKYNPLKYFLPHGIPWSDKERRYADGRIIIPPSEYPKEYGNDGVAFLNDWHNGFVMLVSPRKVGKTIHGGVFLFTHGGLECDPSWPIFTEHRVEYRKFTGPTQIIVGSFGPNNLKELWSAYKEILPRYELGRYAPDWGMMPGEKGLPRHLSFGDGQPKEFVATHSKTRFVFLTYNQRQAAWENFKGKILQADEQIQMNKLRAFLDGTRTMGDYTPVIFTLSGFVLPERPDTGAAGPIKREIYDGRNTRGRSVGRYHMDIPSTPDAIVSAGKKREAYDQYVNPEVERSKEDERRGMACYFPGWEPGGGLLFGPDVWDARVHVIPDWPEKHPPEQWTKYRVIDYADKKTTCCSWFAVGPKFAVLYRILYESCLLIADTAKSVIELSGNTRAEVDMIEDECTGNVYKIYEESQKAEVFYRDLLDPRAAKWRQQGESVIDIFRRYGLTNIDTASGEHNETQIPAFKDWLRIDPNVAHPFLKNEDGTPYMGCPRLFVLESCSGPVIDELEGMPENEDGVRVLDKKFPHDFIDTAKYWASDAPMYLGNIEEHKDEPGDPMEGCSRETGY